MARRTQGDCEVRPSAETNENGPTAVTIVDPTSGGWTFEAQLVHERGVLMLYEPSRAKHRTFCALAAVLKLGWRIVRASPEEQAVLDAHGFEPGWVQ